MRAWSSQGMVEACGGHGDEADGYCARFRWGFASVWRVGAGRERGQKGGSRFFAIAGMDRWRVVGEYIVVGRKLGGEEKGRAIRKLRYGGTGMLGSGVLPGKS